jgi:ribosomal protein S18 acetylase RimI-like enzyme
MEPTIRRATMDDYEALCSIWAEVDNRHADALPRLFRRIDGPARSRQRVADLLADENAAVLVAALGGELLGVVTVTMSSSPSYPMFVSRSWATIEDISVRSAHKRKGIGRALMQAAQDWACQRDAADIELTVWEFNKEARDFYEALGYTTVRRRMSYRLE